MAKKRTKATVPTKPQPTIEDVRKFADQIEAKFGKDANVGYANVSYTQFSIARHYGGCKVQGKHFIYNAVDDSLIREDVVKFIVGLRNAESKTGASEPSGWLAAGMIEQAIQAVRGAHAIDPVDKARHRASR
jgi:hypothetical protein